VVISTVLYLGDPCFMSWPGDKQTNSIKGNNEQLYFFKYLNG